MGHWDSLFVKCSRMVDSAVMAIYLYPGQYSQTICQKKSPTGHPKGHSWCNCANYHDTFNLGTLTVHPWRAGPDCGKQTNKQTKRYGMSQADSAHAVHCTIRDCSPEDFYTMTYGHN